MADLNKETQTEDSPRVEAPSISASDVRKHELFVKLAEDNRTLKERLEAIERAQADKEAEQVLKKKEEEGRYKEIIEEMKREKEQYQEKHSRELLSYKLRNHLIMAGVTNEYFIDGALSRYGGDENGIADYIDGLKSNEQNAVFFGTEKTISGHRPPPTASPGTRSSQDWASVKADLNSRNPETAEAAYQKVKAHMEKTGEMPW